MRYFSVYIKYIPSRQSRNMFITTWTKCLYRFLFIPFRSDRRGLSKRTIPLDYTSTKWKYKRFDISATFRWAGYPPKRAKLPKIASFLNILMLIVVGRSYSNKHFPVYQNERGWTGDEISKSFDIYRWFVSVHLWPYDQGFEHQRNTIYINNRFEISL